MVVVAGIDVSKATLCLAKGQKMILDIPSIHKTSLPIATFFTLVACLALGCDGKGQDERDLIGAVSECIWNEAYAESPTRISNEWLKDRDLMDFLHASNLGSETLLLEAARTEVSGYETFNDFRSAIHGLANNQYADGSPERSFLKYVPHPRNRDEQGTLILLYLHLFHCQEYWQGHEATEVPKHDDALADLAECYWRKVRVEVLSIPQNADQYSINVAERKDYVAASQVDAVFRSRVFAFRNMTPEKMADLNASEGYCE